ncbi:hypothetical protein JCM9492_07080 [Aquifex pyrophilus]
MENYERLLRELSEEEVRYLPLYYLNEVLEQVFLSIGNTPKEKLIELLYILKMNPRVRDKVNELLFLIQ